MCICLSCHDDAFVGAEANSYNTAYIVGNKKTYATIHGSCKRDLLLGPAATAMLAQIMDKMAWGDKY